MDLQKIVKELQVQNSQFQETLLDLAKRQQDMMALLAAKKKPKKKALVNMGRRFKGPAWRASELVSSSKERGGQEEETREEDSIPQESDGEYDSDEEQYPPAVEK